MAEVEYTSITVAIEPTAIGVGVVETHPFSPAHDGIESEGAVGSDFARRYVVVKRAERLLAGFERLVHLGSDW